MCVCVCHVLVVANFIYVLSLQNRCNETDCIVSPLLRDASRNRRLLYVEKGTNLHYQFNTVLDGFSWKCAINVVGW